MDPDEFQAFSRHLTTLAVLPVAVVAILLTWHLGRSFRRNRAVTRPRPALSESSSAARSAWERDYRGQWKVAMKSSCQMWLGLVALCIGAVGWRLLMSDVARQSLFLQPYAEGVYIFSAVGVIALAAVERRQLVHPERYDSNAVTLSLSPGAETNSPRPDLEPLERAVADMLHALDLHHRQVTLLLSLRARGLGICEVGRRIKLVIPAGFLKEVRSNPGGARSKLAHELAHIVQKDTRFWLWLSIHGKYSILSYLVFGQLAALLLIVQMFHLTLAPLLSVPWNSTVEVVWKVHFAFFLSLAFLLFVAGPALGLVGYSRIVRSRHVSEFLADRAGLIFGDSTEYLRFLRGLADKQGSSWRYWFRFHPTPRKRYAAAEAFALRFDVAAKSALGTDP